MAEYRPLYCGFWTDPDTENMSLEEKLIYLFLFSNNKCTESGIYSISDKTIADQTGIKKEKVMSVMESLSTKHKKISRNGNVVFVHSFLKRNFKGRPDLLVKSIEKDISCNNNPIIWEKFRDIYKNHAVIKHLSNTLQCLCKDIIDNDIDIDIEIDNEIEIERGGNDLEKTWRNDFDTYMKECEAGFDKLYVDWDWIYQQKIFYPGVSIRRTLDKMFQQFWGALAGWENKKKKRIKTIDWKATIENNFAKNRVYFGRNETDDEAVTLKSMGKID